MWQLKVIDDILKNSILTEEAKNFLEDAKVLYKKIEDGYQIDSFKELLKSKSGMKIQFKLKSTKEIHENYFINNCYSFGYNTNIMELITPQNEKLFLSFDDIDYIKFIKENEEENENAEKM